jgi:hypothetical protein
VASVVSPLPPCGWEEVCPCVVVCLVCVAVLLLCVWCAVPTVPSPSRLRFAGHSSSHAWTLRLPVPVLGTAPGAVRMCVHRAPKMAGA